MECVQTYGIQSLEDRLDFRKNPVLHGYKNHLSAPEMPMDAARLPKLLAFGRSDQDQRIARLLLITTEYQILGRNITIRHLVIKCGALSDRIEHSTNRRDHADKPIT